MAVHVQLPERERSRLREPGVKLKGVSRRVTGRRHVGGRVHYDSPKGGSAPERVVVARCHAAGLGCLRLPPWIWRALAELRELERRRPAEPLDELLLQLDSTARPRRGLVRALRQLPQRRLARLIDRHSNGGVDPRKPGVPDLFVFKPTTAGRLLAPRFVEVKRPRERLLPHQADELAFMRSIGFKAGVLRLREIDKP